MIRRILGKLLWLANSDPPFSNRTRFYALKDRLLHRWGQHVGYDFQHIVHECWGEYETEGCGPKCRKCGGTGIYWEAWICLERWELGSRIFHSKPTRLYKRPESPISIEGKVEHADVGRAADEALLWLCLLYDWRLGWNESAHIYRYGRGWYPLVNLACLAWFVARAMDRVKPRQCGCGRTWRQCFEQRGWMVCPKCRKTPEEIPF